MPQQDINILMIFISVKHFLKKVEPLIRHWLVLESDLNYQIQDTEKSRKG